MVYLQVHCDTILAICVQPEMVFVVQATKHWCYQ